MIKFQKLGDEEANVEFVQPLVDNFNGESNEVYSKKDGNKWYSLNYFQKVSLGLMILVVILMFSLLVVIWIGANNSHHNDHVQGKNPTTPGVLSVRKTKQGSPTTRTISSTIRSQHVFSFSIGFTFPLQNSISDIKPSYKTTRKIPGVNDIFFKQSTSTDSTVESKNTVDTDVNTAISPHRILATTSSAAKRNTVGNHEIEVSQDTATADVSSVKNYSNNSVDADDSVRRGTSSGTTSSSFHHEIEISQDRNITYVSNLKENTNKSVLDDADDSIGKRTSPETVFQTKLSTKNPSTTGKNNTQISQDKTAVHVPCVKEHTKESVDDVTRKIVTTSEKSTPIGNNITEML